MKLVHTIPKYMIISNKTNSNLSATSLKHLRTIAPLSNISSAKTMYITISKIIDSHAIQQRRKKEFLPFIIISYLSHTILCLNKTIHIPDDSDFIVITSKEEGATQFDFERLYTLEHYDALLCCSPQAFVAFQRCVFCSYFLDDHWDNQLQNLLLYYVTYKMNNPVFISKKHLKISKNNPSLQNFTFDSHLSMTTSGYMHISHAYQEPESKKQHSAPHITQLPFTVHSITPQKKIKNSQIHTNHTHTLQLHSIDSLDSVAKAILPSHSYTIINTIQDSKIKTCIYSFLLIVEHGGVFYDYNTLCAYDSGIVQNSHKNTPKEPLLSFSQTDFSKDTIYNQYHNIYIPSQSTVSPLLFVKQERKKHVQYILSFADSRYSSCFFAAPPKSKLISHLLDTSLDILQTYNRKNKKKLLQFLKTNVTRIVLQELFNIDADENTYIHTELLKEMYSTLQSHPYFAAYIFNDDTTH